ncbi:trafficking kinesin-binding protein 2 isoform X1 [Carcharodon carcharias]|uniref:trafficking kinesin-binding protein 2 isoform X1 n=2 Tax=Carcharodon carcharias TaxID=13397 RepID=UPI001B7E11D0|nr:trafficking kinesin-binding protein 2 isoform X1 [Carcharodon carcharias]
MPENKPMNVNQKETGSITDVCSSEDLPEVELVSLIEDQLTQYHLRADSLYLYQNRDWEQVPEYPGHASSELSPTQAEETFRYMRSSSIFQHAINVGIDTVLSSDRVDQMTRTYNDTDMVTHLLAERDHDLELAARIGQSLLQRNRVLTERNELLEEQLAQAYDQVNQLQHELSKKDDLLRVVANASEESESDSSCSTPLRHNESFHLSHSLMQLDALQIKLRELEDENLSLRSEACHLKTETINYEEKEQQLVQDCVKELKETNIQISNLADELSRKNEDIVRHQEEITNLLSQIVELQLKVKECAIEKEELKQHLQASKDAQRQLTAELLEVQDRNAECLGMLHESQEEVKELRNKSTTSSLQRPQSYSMFPMDSLAAEIEGSMRRELNLEESTIQDQRNQHKRVFHTVRSINETIQSHKLASPPGSIPGSGYSSVVMTVKPHQSVMGPTDTKVSNNSASERDAHCNLSRIGKPGTPGGKDLATALRRLSLRQENYLSEKMFFEDERDRKLLALATEEESSCNTPTESVLSTGTNLTDLTEMSCLSGASSYFRTFLPEKLQIVKPLEGSMTLHQWQQLAQPNLGTILDPRPGVLTKGFELLPEDGTYHLSDLEEDIEEGITFKAQRTSTPEGKENQKQPPKGQEPPPDIFLPITSFSTHDMTAVRNPGKCLSQTNSTFTFTTCRILHPTDVAQVTASLTYAPVPSSGGSSVNMIANSNTQIASCRPSIGESFMNRRESTTTLSSTSSLTKLLLDRGISAGIYRCPLLKCPSVVRPKTLAIPCTPPNSPSSSPCPSPLPFDTRGAMDNFLASRPAETLLQEVYCLKPGRSRADSAPVNLNLVKKLQRMGIAQVVNPRNVPEHDENPECRSKQRRLESAVFMGTGSGLLGGLRRNQSLPSVIGGLGVPVPKMGSLNEEKTETKLDLSA